MKVNSLSRSSFKHSFIKRGIYHCILNFKNKQQPGQILKQAECIFGIWALVEAVNDLCADWIYATVLLNWVAPWYEKGW